LAVTFLQLARQKQSLKRAEKWMPFLAQKEAKNSVAKLRQNGKALAAQPNV